MADEKSTGTEAGADSTKHVEAPVTVTVSSGQPATIISTTSVGISSKHEWPTYVVDIIHSVAWPIAAVFLAYLFRAQIAKVLARMTRVKALGLDLSFELDKTEGVALDMPPSKATSRKAAGPQMAFDSAPSHAEDASRETETNHSIQYLTLEDMTGENPKLAILGAWSSLEIALKKLAGRINIDFQGNSFVLARRFLSMRVIDKPTSTVIHELRIMRNAVAHADEDVEIKTEEAERYIAMTKEVINVLDSLPSSR